MVESQSAEQPVAVSAPSPSVPPARDPSPGVRVTQQIREALTDLGGLALAAYLVQRGAITGQHALLFALALLLPSPLLLRLAKVLGARGSAGAGVAVALLGASAAWAKIKGVAVLGVAAVGLAACLGGCSPTLPADLYRGVGTGVAVTASGGREVALLEARDCLARSSRAEAESCLAPWRARWAPIAQAWQGAASRAQSLAAVVSSVNAALERRWPSMDAGQSAPAPDAGHEQPDAIAPKGEPALVLDGWQRGMCTVPVFAQGAKTLADLDPRRCAVTAPGDRITVFRRGSRWVTVAQ